MLRHLVGVALVLTLGVTAGSESVARSDPSPELLRGVSAIGAPGVPGSLCVFGDGAFPVVVGRASREIREPVVAAAYLGEGRVVAFGHDGYFAPETLAVADTGRLMANAVLWTGGGAAEAGGVRVAVHGLGGLLQFLREQGFAAAAVDSPDWHQRLTGFQVLCLHHTAMATAEQQAAVSGFVRSGGGLIIGDTGWGWLQLHPAQTLTADHPGNRVLAPAGLVWSDGMLDRTADVGFDARAVPSEYVHAGKALEAMIRHTQGAVQLSAEDLAQAAWVVTRVARTLPPRDAVILPRLRRLQEEYAQEAIPSAERPLTMAQPLARLALTLQLQEIRGLPPEQVRAHPAAAEFPGAVPEGAPRVTRTLQVDTGVPGWHSTGLYAAPGEAIRLSIPAEAAGRGLIVRIGAHTDGLWGSDAWRRCPEITCTRPLTSERVAAANAFGGLVYVEVPSRCGLGTVPVEIAGAVEAPHFVLGRTDPVQWREEIRNRPAPWAELETRRVILTVPSSAVRGVDDPVALMELWDHILDSCAELATIPLERERPERYVTDVQISAGYMHSGYPIMCHLDIAPVMTDRARMLANDHGGIWGLFHEMGHNHQSGDWTFDGTGEVTVNLFTLYVFDRVLGTTARAHPAFTPEARTEKMREYLAKGPDFGRWKSDPFLALIMYIQLQEAFGWEAFKRVFAEYRGLREDQRPRTDDEKRDQWLVRFSRTVGRNLGPFFEAWGVPTSEAARASVAGLPTWMPPGFPPAAESG